MKYLTNIDLNGNQLQNFLIHPLATDPTGKGGGHTIYNSTGKVLKYYDGAAWLTLASTSSVSTSLSNFTGTNKITTLGTISTGTWQGSSIADAYISGASKWDAKYDKPSGGIPNGDLANSMVTIGGKSISLGGSATLSDIGVPSWAQAASLAFSSLPAIYIGKTSVQSSAKTQALSGLSSVSFDAQSSVSATAHLEVVTINGVNYLHTSLPFYSDSAVSAGGIGPGGGGGLSVEVLSLSQVRALTSEDLGKVPSAYALKQVDARFSSYYTSTEVDQKLSGLLAEQDALVYRGTIAGGSTGSYGALTPAANKGDLYKVSAAGKIDGVTVEVGDMLICNSDSTAAATSSNYSTVASRWDFIQTNLTSYVTSFGGRSGAITLKAASQSNGAVNLSMSNNELQAAIVGLGSLAYKSSLAYSELSSGITKTDVTGVLGNYVTTFGAQAGAITVRSGSSTRGDVNFSMSSKELQASVVLSDWAKAANKPSYNTGEVTEGTNLYFTNARALAATKGTHPAIRTYTLDSGTSTKTSAYDFKDANILVSVYDNDRNQVMTDVQIVSNGTNYGVKVTLAANAGSALTIVAHGILA